MEGIHLMFHVCFHLSTAGQLIWSVLPQEIMVFLGAQLESIPMELLPGDNGEIAVQNVLEAQVRTVRTYFELKRQF